MIWKLAIRNLVRMPWRTILYFLVVFFVVAAVVASACVRGACVGAVEALDDAYVFVATLVPRGINTAFDEKGHPIDPLLSLWDLGYCLEGADILSYNVAMSENEGVIPSGASMFHFPEKVAPEDASKIYLEEKNCRLIAVENLYLVHPFFTGECTIVEGTGLTAAGYSGLVPEILIPWWLAEQYDISVGDTLIKRYYRSDYQRYTFIESTVVGIYASSAVSPTYADYPAYTSLATAEIDYGTVSSAYFSPTARLCMDRADFVLKGRNDFEAFVKNAKANGLNFQTANILFNNSSYDALTEELKNIDIIALTVLGIVLFVGVGVLVFFTVYFDHSRKKEKEMLRALGMPRHKIFMMIASELVMIAVIAAGLGFFGGRFAAAQICEKVNDTVLAEASESARLRYSEADGGGIGAMPLERETRIRISLSGSTAEIPDVPINETKQVGNGELGISHHNCWDMGTLDTFRDIDWAPKTVVALTSLDVAHTSATFEEIMARPNYYEGNIYCFVNENSGYEVGDWLILSALAKDGCMVVSRTDMSGLLIPKHETVIVAGTYRDNEYCSDDDVLLRMEDYYRFYSRLSITDSDFYFKRIERIVKIGTENGGAENGNS